MISRMFRLLFALIVAASFALLLVADVAAQPVVPPQSEVQIPPPQPIQEPSKKGIADAVEMAFGKDSAEMRRPIRLWLPGLNAVLAAESASIVPGGQSVRFTTASLCFGADPDDIKMFRADEIVIFSDQPVTELGHLSSRNLKFEIHSKNWVVTVNSQNKEDVEKVLVGGPGGKEGLVKRRIALVNGDSIRFKFKIDPETPLADLLPTPLKTPAQRPLWTNEDLAKVPELTIGQSIAKSLPKQKALELTAHGIAKINHLNAKKTDGFLLALLDQRPDLRGLPFLMGDECRTREDQARVFAFTADGVRKLGQKGDREEGAELMVMAATFEALAQAGLMKDQDGRVPRASADQWHRAAVAAMTQIFMPAPARSRVHLAKSLATIPHIDATKALARLVLFSPEYEVRAAAIDGLKLRREKDYTDILVQGFRYPLPAVSKRAAQALVKLERNDLLASLIDVLETPDPRLPVTQKRDGKDVTIVREVVKVNHHRNCLLCHAPGNTDTTPEGVLTVAVPLPGEPLAKPSEGGYNSTPPPTTDIVVRLDMTYLRQDFSLMMPVSDAHPWPEMQRFDFLVRTRHLSAAEAQAYEGCCEPVEPGQLSPYHRAALFALRELTGRDTEPTAAAWRKLLKLPKQAS